MNPVTAVLLLTSSFVAMLAGIGLLKFSTPYARFHAAGKASPVAFLLVALGASIELGWAAAAQFLVASAAMVLTLPVGVHLLFRAVHRSMPNSHLVRDDLEATKRRVAERKRRVAERKRRVAERKRRVAEHNGHGDD